MLPFAPAQADVISDVMDDIILNVVNDPIAAVLLGIGTLLVAFSSLLLGYMTVRGVIAGFAPRSGRPRPRQSD